MALPIADTACIRECRRSVLNLRLLMHKDGRSAAGIQCLVELGSFTCDQKYWLLYSRPLIYETFAPRP